MTIVHDAIRWIIEIWHQFATAVHLEQKKGKTGFLHTMNMTLVQIPIGGILLIVVLLVLFAAMMLAVPVAQMFGYDLATFFAKKQAKYQDKLRSSLWISPFAKMHSSQQKWESTAPAEAIFKNILTVVKNRVASKGKDRETTEIVELDHKNMSVKMHVFSPKMKALDIVEIKCEVGEDLGGTKVTASSFSSGAVPLALPFGLFANLASFWLPFSDHDANKDRLDEIRSTVPDVHIVVPAKEVKHD